MAGMSTEAVEVEPTPEAAEDGTDPKDPFRGNSQRFTWSRALNMGQLQEEISQALGPDVHLAVLHQYDEEDRELPVDAEHPVVVYVTPSSADLAAVRQVMSTHKPDPYYGMTDEEKAQAQLKEKLAAGEPLTPEEMQMAFRMLLG